MKLITDRIKPSGEGFQLLGEGSGDDGLVVLSECGEGALGVLGSKTNKASLNRVKTRCDGCAACHQVSNGLTKGEDLWRGSRR